MSATEDTVNYLLVKLMEECAEVQQRAAKMIQFGADETQPGQSQSNVERLASEVSDLVVTSRLLDNVMGGTILLRGPAKTIATRARMKKMAKYARLSRDLGMITPAMYGELTRAASELAPSVLSTDEEPGDA